MHAGAQVIITNNLKDFPEQARSPYNIETQTPDEFLEHLYDLSPDAMARIVVEQNAARRKPPELLRVTLERLARSAPSFVALVRTHGRVAGALQQEREAVDAAPH